jgi:hypothetical protein
MLMPVTLVTLVTLALLQKAIVPFVTSVTGQITSTGTSSVQEYE